MRAVDTGGMACGRTRARGERGGGGKCTVAIAANSVFSLGLTGVGLGSPLERRLYDRSPFFKPFLTVRASVVSCFMRRRCARSAGEFHVCDARVSNSLSLCHTLSLRACTKNG